MKGNKFPCVHTDTHTLVVLFYQLKNGSVSGTSCCGTGVEKKEEEKRNTVRTPLEMPHKSNASLK